MQINKQVKRPVLMYYGSKWQLAPWIISHFPNHDNYIEPCGGSAAVLLRKPVSKLEVYNDLDGDVVNFFRVLRERPEELKRMLELTPYARGEFEYCKERSDCPLENARRFFVGCQMSISSQPFERSTGWRAASNSKRSHYRSFKNLIDSDYFKHIVDRLRCVQIENKPYQYIVQRYDNESALIYFDPPYTQAERVFSNRYAYEWDNDQHIEAAKLLNACKGKVIVSAYESDLYNELYAGWGKAYKEAQTNAGKKRMEVLYLSPNMSTGGLFNER